MAVKFHGSHMAPGHPQRRHCQPHAPRRVGLLANVPTGWGGIGILSHLPAGALGQNPWGQPRTSPDSQATDGLPSARPPWSQSPWISADESAASLGCSCPLLVRCLGKRRWCSKQIKASVFKALLPPMGPDPAPGFRAQTQSWAPSQSFLSMAC